MLVFHTVGIAFMTGSVAAVAVTAVGASLGTASAGWLNVSPVMYTTVVKTGK